MQVGPDVVVTVLDVRELPAASVAVARTLIEVMGEPMEMLRDQLEPPPDMDPEPALDPLQDSVTEPMPPASDTDAV